MGFFDDDLFCSMYILILCCDWKVVLTKNVTWKLYNLIYNTWSNWKSVKSCSTLDKYSNNMMFRFDCFMQVLDIIELPILFVMEIWYIASLVTDTNV